MIAIEWGTPHHLPICTPSFILVRLHGVAGPPLRCQAIAAGLLGQHRLSCCRRLLRVGLNLLDRYTCTNIVQHGRAQRVSAGPPEYVRLDHVCLACLLSPPPPLHTTPPSWRAYPGQEHQLLITYRVPLSASGNPAEPAPSPPAPSQHMRPNTQRLRALLTWTLVLPILLFQPVEDGLNVCANSTVMHSRLRVLGLGLGG